METPNEKAKRLHDSYFALTREQKENNRIEVCRLFDTMSSITARNNVIAFFYKEELKELEKSILRLDSIITHAEKFLGEI